MSDLSDPRYTGQHVNWDAQLDATAMTEDQAIDQARKAMRGEAEWTPWITVPHILARACAAELAEMRTMLDQLREDLDAVHDAQAGRMTQE
jgi:hypothetical protein